MFNRIWRAALVAALLVLGLLAPGSPAFAGASQTNSSGYLYLCTNGTSLCTNAFGSFGPNAGLNMICWRDDRWDTGIYGSSRWFYVHMDDGREGFVHSSRVRNQTNVQHCGLDKWVTATSWATDRVGQTIYVNDCLVFVHDAWSYVGVEIGGAATAAAYWRAHPDQQVRGNTNPPRGVLVFWDGRPGYPEGHVGISLGNGYVMSTYERTTTPVHVLTIADRNRTHGAWYLGWIRPRF